MDPNEILLWHIEPDSIADPHRIKRFLSWLSADELAQYKRFRFDKHRHTYLVSHALVRGALSRLIGQPPEAFRFRKNAYGKPALETAEAPDTWHFNLSHTDGLAVVALTRRGEIGVDTESKYRDDMTQALAEQFFAPEESRAVAHLVDPEKTLRMLEFWTLKESYIKAVGAGLSIALDSFAFKLANGTKGPHLIRLDAEPEAMAQWRFWQFEPTQTHLVALALKAEVADAPLKTNIKRAEWLLVE